MRLCFKSDNVLKGKLLTPFGSTNYIRFKGFNLSCIYSTPVSFMLQI